jgi:hypothetical protein
MNDKIAVSLIQELTPTIIQSLTSYVTWTCNDN